MRVLIVLALSAWVGAGSAATADEGTTRRKGKHFEVVLHFDSERGADEALALVEALWTHAAAFYDLRKRKPEKLLEIHLYRDTADYEAAEARLTRGKFKRNLAFAHFDTKSAHVALQPEVSHEVLTAQGLPLQTLNLLAHEAAHVVRYAMIPNFRDHPDWFEDGVAQWLKYETLAGLKRIDSVLDDPMSARDFVLIQRKISERALPDVGTLLEDGKGKLSFYERYAARRLLVSFLASGSRGPRFAKFRQALRRMGGGKDYTARAHERLKEAFGASAYTALVKDFPVWVQRQVPTWDEIYRSLDARGSTWRQSAFPTSNALAWRTQAAWGAKASRTPNYGLEGAVEILPSYGKQMNLLLGRGEAGFVSVAITAGYGVNVFDYDAKKNSWKRLLSLKCPAIEQGTRIPFSLQVKGQRLLGRIGGAKDAGVAIDVEIPAHHTMRGAWGVGAQRGTSGVWHDVRQVAQARAAK